jgi:2-polyprenyl-3-methyl-5-hydroxy-6-metoxy-1,4-benzoquinol methylase
MSCCRQCEGLENLFDSKVAREDLAEYHKSGATGTTRTLLDQLRAANVAGMSLLDIGGGVGVIQHELVKSGVSSTIGVDASSAYLATARQEAARQGYAERAQYHFGDFIQIAPTLDSSDIVTLDRVICCFPDMPNMVRLSAAHARRFYGVIYPQDGWWLRAAQQIAGAALALVRNKYRFYIHSTREIDALIREQGLRPRFHQRAGLIWQVFVYERA